jgi:trehalose synthase
MMTWPRFRPLDPAELSGVIRGDRLARLRRVADRARTVLGGRVVVHVNATATGGGVAEMLPTLLGYARGFGVETRWAVVGGGPEFFRVTKRMHNHLHGHLGDAGPLDEPERLVYERALAGAGRDLLTQLTPGDIVVLHDPQTLGLAPLLASQGIRTVWRCHIGVDQGNAITRRAWRFLQPYLAEVDRFVFSRATYRPDSVPAERTHIITPTLDPLSLKNSPLSAVNARAMLAQAGLLQPGNEGAAAYRRRDGSWGHVRRRAQIVQSGPPPAHDQPLVVQVSRWDRLKDMPGVMIGFAENIADSLPAHLILAGPMVSGVSDDPEGASELQRCVDMWHTLPRNRRDRIHLACLPVTDVEENAALVNALQRHATVVTQKSLAEGFGLTVLEAMWKGRPVVASAVGGIRDQIQDQKSGLLLPDPHDLAGFGQLVRELLEDPQLAESIGRAGADRAAEFLPDRSLIAWAELITAVAHHEPAELCRDTRAG